MKWKTPLGALLIALGILLFAVGPQLSISTEYGTFYVNDVAMEDGGSYQLGTRSLSLRFIEAEGIPSGSNLIVNPGFELGSGDSPDNWLTSLYPPGNTTGTFEWLSTGAYDGTKCMKITIDSVTEGWGTAMCEQIPGADMRNRLKEGTTYHVRVHYRSDGVGSGAIIVRAYTYNWTRLQNIKSPDFAPTSTWQAGSWFEFTTLSGADWTNCDAYRIYFRQENPGTITYDACELYEITSGSAIVESVRAEISYMGATDTVSLTQSGNTWTASYLLANDGLFALKGYATIDGVEYTVMDAGLDVDTSTTTNGTEEETPTEDVGTDVQETGETQTTPQIVQEYKVDQQSSIIFGIAAVASGCVLLIAGRRRKKT